MNSKTLYKLNKVSFKTHISIKYNIDIPLSLLLLIHVKMPSKQSFENTYNV